MIFVAKGMNRQKELKKASHRIYVCDKKDGITFVRRYNMVGASTFRMNKYYEPQD